MTPRRPPGLTDSLTDRARRARLRDGIAADHLPRSVPNVIAGRLGSGGPCAVCHRPIATDQLEVELHFRSTSGNRTPHVDARCLRVWQALGPGR
jgi:hypothetical protein